MPTADRSKLEKSLVGPSGEHYVLSCLYRRGMLASMAPPGSPTVDILVINPDETIIATVQVKTRTRGGDGGWHMSAKHEEFSQPHSYYAFVDFEAGLSGLPVVYIVPSAVVAEVVRESHKAWLNTPGRGGVAHNDSELRRIKHSYKPPWDGYKEKWLDEYRERWDLLGKSVGTEVTEISGESE